MNPVFSKIWYKISNLGIDSSIENSESRRTRIFNQIAFFTACALFIPLLFLFIHRSVSDLIVLFTFVIACLVLLLNSRGHTTASKFIAFLTLTLAISLHLICFGNNYAIAFAYVCLLALTYSFLNNKFDRHLTGGFILLCYIQVRLFLAFYEPLLYFESGEIRNDFAFIMIGTICLVALSLYVKESQNQLKENKALLEMLEEQNSELEKANSDLESFTYIASHDLKTPVRTVNSFISLIHSKTESSNDSELKEYVGFAKRGAKKLTQLIQDILNYSQIDKNTPRETELLDLNELVKEISYIIKGQDRYENCEIKSTMLPTIVSNRVNFHQLFQNLIENGLKYNKSNVPTVKIEAHGHNNVLKLSFEDNGIGIDEEYKDQIFAPFKRLHTEDKYEGTGIGLAICKRIVESMNGNISVKDHQKNGTTMLLYIPTKQSFVNGHKIFKTS